MGTSPPCCEAYVETCSLLRDDSHLQLTILAFLLLVSFFFIILTASPFIYEVLNSSLPVILKPVP
jgi:hypothetical protein